MAWKGGLERALDRCNAVLRPTGLQIAWYSGADRRTADALRRQGAKLRYRDLQFFRGITAPGHITIEEARFLADLAQASAPDRPIVEIGTLFGFSTLVLARAKHPGQRLITVDNYCWNPLGLPPDAHARATAAVLQDGWYYSGDGAYMDEEGFVYIVDRLKDMIISGGENVYSAEVENAISLMPGVAEVAVIGVPDERWGERVHAIIVARQGTTLTADDVMAHCREQIAGYKCPRSVDFRDQPLPLSGAGKVLKRDLREPYWKGFTKAVN